MSTLYERRQALDAVAEEFELLQPHRLSAVAADINSLQLLPVQRERV